MAALRPSVNLSTTIAPPLSPAALPPADRPATRLATRLAFWVAGFGVACWAPLIPFAKQRLAIDEAMLGLLLLCLGVGCLVAMFFTGILSVRFGAKPITIAGGFGVALVLPLLAVLATPLTLGLGLFAFGLSLGAMDVAMNIHALEVEKGAGKPLMSAFHALFSVGGLAGAAVMTLLLSLGVGAAPATLLCSLTLVGCMAVAAPRLLPCRAEADAPLFALPKGAVLLLANLAAISFLVEGAILDWGALLSTEKGFVSAERGGLGFMLFSVAMTVGRLTGDRVTLALGDSAVLRYGGACTVLGFAVLLLAPWPVLALGGFVLIGLGASNVVPVLFRRGAAQQAMPANLAVAAITTFGYTGHLAGPAAVGFVAKAIGLPAAFWLLAALFALIPLTARRVTDPPAS